MSNKVVADILLGANAKAQALAFLFCLLVGIASGMFALLYFRKSSPIERALTDLVATLLLGGGMLVCIEFFLDGKIELYGIVAFCGGVSIIPLMFAKIRKSVKTRKNKRQKE